MNLAPRLTLASLLLIATIGCKGKDEAKKDPAPAKAPAGDKAAPDKAEPKEEAKPASKGACSLLTLEEAAAALGHPVKYRSEDPEATNCIVEKDGDPSPDDIMVDFEVNDDGKATYDYGKSVKHEEIADLGDAPGLWQTGNPGVLITIKGGKSLNVTLMQSKQGGDVKAPAVAIAKAVLGRM